MPINNVFVDRCFLDCVKRMFPNRPGEAVALAIKGANQYGAEMKQKMLLEKAAASKMSK